MTQDKPGFRYAFFPEVSFPDMSFPFVLFPDLFSRDGHLSADDDPAHEPAHPPFEGHEPQPSFDGLDIR